jgi:galactokinase
MGGCIMALVREEAVEALRDYLTELFYRPRGLEPRVLVCTPVGGSSVLMGGAGL